jgi:AraC-like DNA-binding protein
MEQRFYERRVSPMHRSDQTPRIIALLNQQRGALDMLARELGRSDRTLRRHSERTVGYEPMVLDRVLRSRRAIRLIRRGWPLAATPALAGYADPRPSSAASSIACRHKPHHRRAAAGTSLERRRLVSRPRLLTWRRCSGALPTWSRLLLPHVFAAWRKSCARTDVDLSQLLQQLGNSPLSWSPPLLWHAVLRSPSRVWPPRPKSYASPAS